MLEILRVNFSIFLQLPNGEKKLKPACPLHRSSTTNRTPDGVAQKFNEHTNPLNHILPMSMSYNTISAPICTFMH